MDGLRDTALSGREQRRLAALRRYEVLDMPAEAACRGLNGRQVADAARTLRPDLKVLFITGYAENAVFHHGHLGRGMEVLTKPFAISDLTSRLERLLREG